MHVQASGAATYDLLQLCFCLWSKGSNDLSWFIGRKHYVGSDRILFVKNHDALSPSRTVCNLLDNLGRLSVSGKEAQINIFESSQLAALEMSDQALTVCVSLSDNDNDRSIGC